MAVEWMQMMSGQAICGCRQCSQRVDERKNEWMLFQHRYLPFKGGKEKNAKKKVRLSN